MCEGSISKYKRKRLLETISHKQEKYRKGRRLKFCETVHWGKKDIHVIKVPQEWFKCPKMLVSTALKICDITKNVLSTNPSSV